MAWSNHRHPLSSAALPPRRGEREAPRRRSFRELTALILIIAGIVMAFTAMLLPPPGMIHESVLYLFAQILIYAGSVFGIAAYVQTSVNQSQNHQHCQSQNQHCQSQNQQHYESGKKEPLERDH